MATTVYLTNDASTVDQGVTEYVASLGVRGNGVVSDDVPTVAAGQAPIDAGGTAIYWYSPPVQAVTISGTISYNLRMAESGMTANQTWQLQLARCSGAGALIETLFSHTGGTELGTSEAARTGSASPTSRTFVDGDRIRFIVLTAAMIDALTGFTTTLWYDGTSAGASGDSYITFTETITEYTPPGGDDPFPYVGAGYYGFRRLAERLDGREFWPRWRRRPSGVLVPS